MHRANQLVQLLSELLSLVSSSLATRRKSWILCWHEECWTWKVMFSCAHLLKEVILSGGKLTVMPLAMFDIAISPIALVVKWKNCISKYALVALNKCNLHHFVIDQNWAFHSWLHFYGLPGRAMEELRGSLYNEFHTSEGAKRQQQRFCGPGVALTFNFVVSVGIIMANKMVCVVFSLFSHFMASLI